MYTFVKYKHLCIGYLNHSSYGDLRMSSYTVRKRSVMGKIAVLDTDCRGQGVPLGNIRYRNWGSKGSEEALRTQIPIFVAPECATSRDLIRNSGYKITHDKSKTNCVVVPSFDNTPVKTFLFNTASYNEGEKTLTLWTFSENRDLYDMDKLFADFVELMRLKGETVYGDCIYGRRECCLLNPCDDYIDMINDTVPQGRWYIFEQNLLLKTSNEITVENLEIWNKLPYKSNLLEQMLINSNWRDYPATIAVFLTRFPSTSSIFYSTNRNTKMMLSEIKFDKYTYASDILKGRVIQPKDWNMLQDWLLHQLSLSENGGVVIDNNTTVGEHSWSFYGEKLLRHRIVAAPLRIDAPMLYENILELL